MLRWRARRGAPAPGGFTRIDAATRADSGAMRSDFEPLDLVEQSTIEGEVGIDLERGRRAFEISWWRSL